MKKMVLCFLLVMISVGCFFSANAAEVKEPYLAQSYALFGAKGNYDQWSLIDKTDWLKILLPASTDADEQTILDLLEAKDESLIDAYLSARYGVEDRPDLISIHYVLEEAWGEEYGWTLEQRAQQTVWIETYMPNLMWDIYHYEIPGEGAILPEEAAQIAQNALMGAGILSPDVPFDSAVAYGVHRRDLAEMPCHYVVNFRTLREVGGVAKMRPFFTCYVTKEGQIMDASYNRYMSFSEVTPSPFPELPYSAFSAWPLEEKADFSDAFYDDMAAYMKENPNYRGVYYFATRCRYGMPDDQSIDQAQAEQLARDAALSLGAAADYVSRAGARFFFDVTDAQKPLWKVYLSTLFSANTRYGDPIGYFVIIDAHNGNIVDGYERTGIENEERFY